MEELAHIGEIVLHNNTNIKQIKKNQANLHIKLNNLSISVNRLCDKISSISLKDECIECEKTDKEKIIELFNEHVKNKEIILKKFRHCGDEGHWLETQMGISHNSNNKPDIFGYEMKKLSKKITFGDFSASEYLFSRNRKIINNINKWNQSDIPMSRDEFIKTFGTPNTKKNNRYSWSGRCVPTYNKWNKCGQIMKITPNNDIHIYYSYSKDGRDIKKTFHKLLKKNNVLIVVWLNTKLRTCINRKFNSNGFFVCKKEGSTYQKICFGSPFNYEYFIDGIKKRYIIFDSGMYVGNSRNYSQFRSSYGNFWQKLITEY